MSDMKKSIIRLSRTCPIKTVVVIIIIILPPLLNIKISGFPTYFHNIRKWNDDSLSTNYYYYINNFAPDILYAAFIYYYWKKKKINKLNLISKY